MQPCAVGTRIIYIPWKDMPSHKYGRGILIRNSGSLSAEPSISLEEGAFGSCGGWHNLMLAENDNILGKFPKKEGAICPLLSRQLRSADES